MGVAQPPQVSPVPARRVVDSAALVLSHTHRASQDANRVAAAQSDRFSGFVSLNTDLMAQIQAEFSEMRLLRKVCCAWLWPWLCSFPWLTCIWYHQIMDNRRRKREVQVQRREDQINRVLDSYRGQEQLEDAAPPQSQSQADHTQSHTRQAATAGAVGGAGEIGAAGAGPVPTDVQVGIAADAAADGDVYATAEDYVRWPARTRCPGVCRRAMGC